MSSLISRRMSVLTRSIRCDDIALIFQIPRYKSQKSPPNPEILRYAQNDRTIIGFWFFKFILSSFQTVKFQNVADLIIVEILNADAALVAGGDLADVVLKALQAADGRVSQ